MKIISLQSVGLGNSRVTITYTGELAHASDPAPTPLVIDLGKEYRNSKAKVTSIKLAVSTGLPEQEINPFQSVVYHSAYYKVTTSDGHIRVLPEQAYIAEWVEEDDQND